MNIKDFLFSPDVIDFHEDIDKAKNWGKNFNHLQEQKMNREDHRAFNIFSMHWRQINDYLRTEKGVLIKDLEILKQKNYDVKINEKIAAFDQTLDKLSIGHTLQVYRRVDGSFFGIEKPLRKNKEIDTALAHEIQNNYQNKTKIEHGYISTSLSKHASGSYFNAEQFPILIKIKLPPDTKAIYISEISDHTEELELLLKRGYKLRYQQIAVSNDRGHQIIEMNATIEK